MHQEQPTAAPVAAPAKPASSGRIHVGGGAVSRPSLGTKTLADPVIRTRSDTEIRAEPTIDPTPAPRNAAQQPRPEPQVRNRAAVAAEPVVPAQNGNTVDMRVQPAPEPEPVAPPAQETKVAAPQRPAVPAPEQTPENVQQSAPPAVEPARNFVRQPIAAPVQAAVEPVVAPAPVVAATPEAEPAQPAEARATQVPPAGNAAPAPAPKKPAAASGAAAPAQQKPAAAEAGAQGGPATAAPNNASAAKVSATNVDHLVEDNVGDVRPDTQTTEDIRAEVVEGLPPSIEPWVDTLLLAARTLGVQSSPELVHSASVWAGESEFHDAIVDVALSAGLIGQFVKWDIRDLSQIMLPALMPISSKYVGMIVSINDGIVNLVVPVSGKVVERALPIDQLSGFLEHPILLVRERDAVRDGRLDDFMTFKPDNWLRDIFINNKGTIFELCIGSLFGNFLAIGTSLFAMQVWDRVVPARSTDTLWVLASGVALALAIEFCIRTARITLADHFGKRADLRLSALFFSRALDIKSDARPKSPGTLISQLRDLDQMRELLTSTTMGVMIDLPFVILFLFIIWMIGGPLVWVPIAAIPILIIPGLIAQVPLSDLADQGLSETALRNALLMETIHRVEDIKILQAEPRFRNLWNKVNRVAADISMKQRFYSSLILNFTSTVQQLAYIGVVITGVYGIIDGNLTFGAVLACSILTSRTIAPLAQVSGVFTRLQNARVSKRSLDGLLSLPVDHDPEKDGYHKPNLVGNYRFEKVLYGYDPEEPPVLSIPSLRIKQGEKIAILGRVGAGKSTLLRLAGGLAQPQQGRILFNGISMNLIDVADVRRDIGFLMQDSSLFYGTLRENLLLGNPLASDEEVLEAMHISCADQLLLNQPHGLDLILREGGKGLSGGQKQTLMLSRLVLRSPNILLLDEPTASLDEATEVAVISRLNEWIGNRTMIVATHRYSMLSMVDRIIVVEGGRIALDGPKDDILNGLKQNPNLAGQPDAKIAKKPQQTRIENNG